MPYFAVIREAGPGWVPGRTMRQQPCWSEHAACMDRLVDDGLVLFGGPLAESDRGRVRALLIVRAGDEAEIRRRLDEDPWTPSGLLTTHVDRWELLMGAQRMKAARRAP